MSEHDWQVEDQDLVRVLSPTLQKETCPEIIDSFEVVAHSIWRLATPFLGDAATKALLARSLSLASRDAPLLEAVKVTDAGLDLSELRANVLGTGCAAPEVVDTLLRFLVAIFRTVEVQGGRAVSQHLLRLIREEQKQPRS